MSISAGRSRSVPGGGLKVLFELQQWLEREEGDGLLERVRPTLERFLAAGSNESLSRETREALIGVVALVRDLSRGITIKVILNVVDCMTLKQLFEVHL